MTSVHKVWKITTIALFLAVLAVGLLIFWKAYLQPKIAEKNAEGYAISLPQAQAIGKLFVERTIYEYLFIRGYCFQDVKWYIDRLQLKPLRYEGNRLEGAHYFNVFREQNDARSQVIGEMGVNHQGGSYLSSGLLLTL